MKMMSEVKMNSAMQTTKDTMDDATECVRHQSAMASALEAL